MIVHILHEGRALCGLAGIPSTWPEDHRWISKDQPGNVSIPGDITMCASCLSQIKGQRAEPDEQAGS